MMEKNSNSKILEFDHEDDQKNYEEFSNFLNEDNEIVKKRDANLILEMGDDLISEIEDKNKLRFENQKKQVKYIIKKSNKYSEKYLLDLHYKDVNDIYNEIKFENRSIFIKIIDFFST